MPVAAMHSSLSAWGGAEPPAGGSKDFYVDNLLRTRTLAKPVPAYPAEKTDLKFGVNAILALDSRDKIAPSTELYNPSEYIGPLTYHLNKGLSRQFRQPPPLHYVNFRTPFVTGKNMVSKQTNEVEKLQRKRATLLRRNQRTNFANQAQS